MTSFEDRAGDGESPSEMSREKESEPLGSWRTCRPLFALRANNVNPIQQSLVNRVNQLIHKSSPLHSYASLFYAEYDPSTRTLAYVNVGQNPPVVVRCEGGRSKLFRLESSGPPVGLFENSNYELAEFQLEADGPRCGLYRRNHRDRKCER
jgi:hypothetical protein